MSIEKTVDAAGYWVRWRDSAGRQHKKKVALWRDAVALDGELKRKRVMGELLVHEKGTIRLCDFWDVFVAQYGDHLSPRTLDSYERLWHKHIRPSLGTSRLRALTREDASRLVARCSSTLKPNSVRRVLAVLSCVLQRAVEWGYIGANPATGVKKPRLTTRRGRALTDRQLGALVSELPNLRSQAYATVLAWTGMRPGELRTRRWLDLSPELIFVEAPKTNTTRSVDLRPEARRALLEWYLAQGQPAPAALIFPAAGAGPWTDNGYRLWQRKVFGPAATRAGLRGLVPYDLRHTAASRLIAEGRDVLYVARQLGHSPEITLRTYAHEFEQQRKSVPSECPGEVDIARILRAAAGI